MIFRAYYKGELWGAEAGRDDIFATGDSLAESIRNADVAGRVRFSGSLAPGDVPHVLLADEAGAGG